GPAPGHARWSGIALLPRCGTCRRYPARRRGRLGISGPAVRVPRRGTGSNRERLRYRPCAPGRGRPGRSRPPDRYDRWRRRVWGCWRGGELFRATRGRYRRSAPRARSWPASAPARGRRCTQQERRRRRRTDPRRRRRLSGLRTPNRARGPWTELPGSACVYPTEDLPENCPETYAAAVSRARTTVIPVTILPHLAMTSRF